MAKINNGVLPTVAGATGTAVGSIPGASAVTTINFVISGLAAETITVTGLIKATVFTSALRPVDLGTGALAAASALPNGSYILRDCVFDEFKFTKSGATDPAVITWRAKDSQAP